MTFKQQLIKMKVCKGAIKWVENRTLQQAWNDCHRGDWMLWLLEKMKGKEGWLDEKEIMLLSCWCARRTLKYIPEGEDRPLKAIETKEKWTRGEITREEMYIAMDAANAAATNAVSDTVRNAVSAAANAVASDAASAAANTVAWDAAWNAAWDVAWDANTANAATNAAASAAASDAARAVARAVASDAARAVASDAAWDAAYDKESSIQADYIRTQFAPPV